MPSFLGSRNFATGTPGSGSARAKKIADLYIKNHTNDAGVVTDPGVYQYVNDNILAPYADDVSIQQKIAGYQNSMKKLSAQAFDQDNTLGVFKENVSNALYMRGDVIRDPALMALASASALDNVVNSIDTAISEAESNGKSSDKLKAYREEVAATAGAQRDLVNALNSGTSPQNLDGYGYFVKTNPIDGSLVGAALLPVNSAPAEIKQGMDRIDNTVNIGSAKMPVYLPTVTDSSGQKVAKLYGNTWSGSSGDPVLAAQSAPDFSNKDTFDLTDNTKFPIKKTDIAPGQFGRVVSGVKDNQTQFSYYYRGKDGTVRQVDQAGMDAFKQDPMFKDRMSYIPILNPDEVKSLGTIERVNPSDVPKWSAHAALDQSTAEQQRATQDLAAVNANPFFGAAEVVKNTVSKIGGAVTSFFGSRVNRQNKPETAPAEGSKTSYSAPDVVNNGKDIFAGGDGARMA